MKNTAYQSESLRKALAITKKLEETGVVNFKRINTKIDNTKHKAVVSDGLIIVDDKYEMTWDSFTHLYLFDFANQDAYIKIIA